MPVSSYFQNKIEISNSFSQTEFNKKQLPNFLSLKSDVWSANILMNSIFGMINYKLSSEMRIKMAEKMEDIIVNIAESNMEYFI